MINLLLLRQKYDASFREIEMLTNISRSRLHQAESKEIKLTIDEEKLIKSQLKKYGFLCKLSRLQLFSLVKDAF